VGREFRADQDRGRIHCRTLYPPDAVLEKIGGPGKEFWADGMNWPVPADSPYARNIGMTNGVVPENIGRWRVEVKPGAAREQDYFLHLIKVGDPKTLEEMTSSALIEDDKTIGVEFQAGARTVRVAFNKEGFVGGQIKIAEGGKVLAERPLATIVQRQKGLGLVN